MNIKLKKIVIKAKREIFSEIAGENLSIFKNEGFEFVELREYQYGDDVKKIDWIISAKQRRPYVKVFKEERELNVLIALMLNGNIYFGSKRFKKDLAIEIALLLGFSAIKNQDSFSYRIFADRLYQKIKPTKNIHAIYKMANEIDRFNSLGKKADFKVLADTLYKIKRKSLIFIISDFIGEFDFKLLSKKHEIVAIIIRDRLEEAPIELGFANLLNPENYQSVMIDLNKNTKKDYEKSIKRNDYFIYQHFRKNRIKFVKIYTDEEPFAKLIKLFR